MLLRKLFEDPSLSFIYFEKKFSHRDSHSSTRQEALFRFALQSLKRLDAQVECSLCNTHVFLSRSILDYFARRWKHEILIRHDIKLPPTAASAVENFILMIKVTAFCPRIQSGTSNALTISDRFL